MPTPHSEEEECPTIRLEMVSAPANRELFLHVHGNTYNKISTNDLKETVCFKSGNIYRSLYHKTLGTIILSKIASEYKEEVKKLIFTRDGNLMKPLCLSWYYFNAREKTKTGKLLHYSVDESYSIKKTFYKVENGQIIAVTKLDDNANFTFDQVSITMIREEVTDTYESREEAQFFNCAQIASEEHKKSWSEILCLSDEQKEKVNELMKEFKEKLKEINVDMSYFQDDGEFVFIRSKSSLPEDFYYEFDDAHIKNNPESNFAIPLSAYFLPKEQIRPFEVFNSDYLLWVKQQQKLPKIS